jgi:hypothetical protein
MTAWMDFLRRYDTVFHQINIDMASKGNVHAIRNKLLWHDSLIDAQELSEM